MPYSIKAINGLAVSHLRGVVFLVNDDSSLNAESYFRSMSQPGKARSNQERIVLTRMDYWITGGHNDRYFHGWPNDRDNSSCFTFKWHFRNVDQRFYGFLCNPLRISNPRFQLCVLHSHDAKTQRFTEPAHLELANRLARTPDVWTAIRYSYPDS